MKNWKDIFVPNDDRFVTYLVQQAQAASAAMGVLYQFLMQETGSSAIDDLISEMSLLEKQGDAVRKRAILELLDTFVTPIDREDIYALSRSIDNILDYADSTVKELVLYDVEPTTYMREMVGVLKESVSRLEHAVETMLKDPQACVQDMVFVKRAENRIEELYRTANAALFDMTDMNFIFKVREVYRHLSNCADRMDEAADIIGNIIIKGNI